MIKHPHTAQIFLLKLLGILGAVMPTMLSAHNPCYPLTHRHPSWNALRLATNAKSLRAEYYDLMKIRAEIWGARHLNKNNKSSYFDGDRYTAVWVVHILAADTSAFCQIVSLDQVVPCWCFWRLKRDACQGLKARTDLDPQLFCDIVFLNFFIKSTSFKIRNNFKRIQCKGSTKVGSVCLLGDIDLPSPSLSQYQYRAFSSNV